MTFIKKYDKPKEYPYGYAIHKQTGIVTAINKQGYIGNDTDLTMWLTFILILLFPTLLILGGYLLLK